MTTSNLTFSSTAQSATGPGGTNISLNVPAALYPGFSKSFSTTLFSGSILGGYPITGTFAINAGLTGGINLTTGTYTPNFPVAINVALPTTTVADGSTFTVDPELASVTDATFALSGVAGNVSLDLGVAGKVAFSFNKASSIGASININSPFSYQYQLPTSHSVNIPGVPGASITIAEPTAFSVNSPAGTTTGSLPTLTATGQGNAIFSASLDVIALLASLDPPLAAIIGGSYGVSGIMASYSLISAPITAALELGETVTLTPSLSVQLTDTQNNEVRSGPLGQAFTFDAPTSGSGMIPIQAVYTLNLQVSTSIGLVGNLSFTIDGPQAKGSIAGANFSVGPLGSLQVFSVTSGQIVTLDTASFSQALTANDAYQVAYDANCYLRGTRILTAAGEVAIESLRPGDRVVALRAGGLSTVRWIGHRDIDLRSHPRPDCIRPIRVAAHAFADGRPHRDLWLSPGHSVFVDGVLIPIEKLINGASIAQFPADRVSYYHLELDDHDIVLAEGLPAESYLDTGNRAAFANGGMPMDLHPDFLPKDPTDTCVPLVQSGPALAAVHARLLARATEALGYAITDDRGLHLRVDGSVLEAEDVTGDTHHFRLPADAQDVRLVSRTWVPAELKPDSVDRRRLGVCVSRVVLDGAHEVPLERLVLRGGWHPIEGQGRAAFCWTQGEAQLPRRAGRLSITLTGRRTYWTHDQASQAAAAPLPRLALAS